MLFGLAAVSERSARHKTADLLLTVQRRGLWKVCRHERPYADAAHGAYFQTAHVTILRAYPEP